MEKFTVRFLVLLCAVIFICSHFSLNIRASNALELPVDFQSSNSKEYTSNENSTGNFLLSSCCEETSPLSTILEKRTYEDSENIRVSFRLSSNFTWCDYDYQMVGFEVVSEVLSDSENSLDFELVHIDGVVTPCFSLFVTTDIGYESSNIFGLYTDAGLFLSVNSYDSAREEYYYSMVRDGSISMDDFNALLQYDFGMEGTETVSVVRQRENTSSVYVIQDPYVHISGLLRWTDDNNVSHPMQYNKVEIYDTLNEVLLGTVYTDKDGNYSFVYTNPASISNICIKVYAGGENSSVKTANGGDYVYTSGQSTGVVPNSSVNINWTVGMSSDLGKAFQISQAINVSTQYVKQMNGSYLSDVAVIFPEEESNGCYYTANNHTIHITNRTGTALNSYASWDVIMHEYGHHVQHELGISNSPGGSHSFGENLADSRNKSQGIRLAWGESYPSVLSGMIQAYYYSSLTNIVSVGDTQYSSYNGASLNYESSTICLGEACEASIIGVLWDLFDTASDGVDSISMTHAEYWAMMKNCQSTTMSDFCNYFYSTYSSSKITSLNKLLSYYGMAASGLQYTSSTRILLSWTANGTSATLPNNQFDLYIYDSLGQSIVCKTGLTTTSCRLSADESQIVRNYSSVTIVVVSYQTSSPTTGGYASAPLTVTP